jgi:tRNA (cytidine/uridine-2'-O-)-methyltransferase
VLHVVLFQPEIPPNTGNVIRLCANSGAALHLVRPLGFELDDRKLRRAGLDYHEFATIAVHDDLANFITSAQPRRLLALSTHGRMRYDTIGYADGDALVFGPETRGLPRDVLDGIDPAQRVRLPMRPHSRSLNLSNAVAIVVYEAWRQLGFAGATQDRP